MFYSYKTWWTACLDCLIAYLNLIYFTYALLFSLLGTPRAFCSLLMDATDAGSSICWVKTKKGGKFTVGIDCRLKYFFCVFVGLCFVLTHVAALFINAKGTMVALPNTQVWFQHRHNLN